MPMLKQPALMFACLKNVRTASLLGSLLVIAPVAWTLMHRLDVSFVNDFDEGTYLCSARMVRKGYPLFDSVFSSQPPVFVESLALWFGAFGDSVKAARGMVAFFGVISLISIGLIGRSLFGPLAGPLAILCFSLLGAFVRNVQMCTAEIPSIAFTLAATVCILSARDKWYPIWAVLGGAVFSVAVLTKLIVVPMVVPISVILILRPQFKCDREPLHISYPRLGFPILLFVAAGVAVALCVLSTYDLRAVYDQSVAFHEQSKKAYPLAPLYNWSLLKQFLLENLGMAILALAGLGLLWKLNRTAWLVCYVWTVAAAGFILTHSPLFNRHFLLLAPPMALASSAAMQWVILKWRTKSWRPIVIAIGMLPLVSVNTSSWQLGFTVARELQGSAIPIASDAEEAMRLIESYTVASDSIVTDEQMLAFRSGRSVPPSLCDTSFNRIATGYLTDAEAIEGARGAKMVILWTHRLEQLSRFTAWVESHYRLLKAWETKKIYVRDDKS